MGPLSLERATMARSYELDVDVPEKLPEVLRHAAELYYESEAELQASWGDPQAGRVWREFAKILERAADSCDKAIDKFV